MLYIDGKTYAINFDKVVTFCNYSDLNKSKETEITDGYEQSENGEGLTITTKVVRQLTAPGNNQIDNIKYDLVKTFILYLLDVKPMDINDFGTQVVLNTLIKEEILIEII